ncbi:MAG TPA: flagellar biosynthesis protein FliQ [Armatimonadota bacterium]|nr:flagellar biosynthesis protein FliQ [Armatimonadota bacterium]
MTQETVMDLARRSLMLAMQLCLPAVGIGMVVGLAVSIVQAATQIQESTLGIIPRIAAIFIALAFFGPWMLNTAVKFTAQIFLQMAELAK